MQSDHVKLLDAGMGKTLSMKGVEIPSTIWSANALLVAPEIVVEVHKENIEAGANIITTNSGFDSFASLIELGILAVASEHPLSLVVPLRPEEWM